NDPLRDVEEIALATNDHFFESDEVLSFKRAPGGFLTKDERIENHRVLLAEIPAVVDVLGALKPLPVDSGQEQLPGAGTCFVLKSRDLVTFKQLSQSSA